MGDGRALIARNRPFYPLSECEPRVFTTLLAGVSESVCEICGGSFFFSGGDKCFQREHPL